MRFLHKFAFFEECGVGMRHVETPLVLPRVINSEELFSNRPEQICISLHFIKYLPRMDQRNIKNYLTRDTVRSKKKSSWLWPRISVGNSLKFQLSDVSLKNC
jgi:hypothetical protein